MLRLNDIMAVCVHNLQPLILMLSPLRNESENFLPLEKGVALHLNKLESPSTKYALCQVWLKLA